ncbi:MAG: hypothetical protein R3E50_16055 [Halioglobus sp.]
MQLIEERVLHGSIVVLARVQAGVESVDRGEEKARMIGAIFMKLGLAPTTQSTWPVAGTAGMIWAPYKSILRSR